MKISTVTIFAATLAFFAGCNSLDNPLGNLFHGHDTRVYNPQTGEWDDPNKKATPAPQKSAAVASALSATPAPQSGTRTSDWVEKRNVSPDAAPAPAARPVSNPGTVASTSPADPPAAAPPPAAPAPAPPPRPTRATGYYNPTTGKIEWQASDATTATTASATPPAAGTKHWWWPF